MPEIGGQENTVPAPHDPPSDGGDVGRWRARALEAEEKIGQLEATIADLRRQLEGAASALDAMKTRREVEQQLLDARARDVETALLLVEKTLAADPGADVGRAVADVKQRKPHLFDPPADLHAAAGPAPRADYHAAADAAYARARSQGGARRGLLDYLRAKRRS